MLETVCHSMQSRAICFSRCGLGVGLVKIFAQLSVPRMYLAIIVLSSVHSLMYACRTLMCWGSVSVLRGRELRLKAYNS